MCAATVTARGHARGVIHAVARHTNRLSVRGAAQGILKTRGRPGVFSPND